MDPAPTNLLHFLQLDRLPYAVLVIAVAWLISRAGTRTLDALGERFTNRRLAFKQASAIGRFLVIILATVLVVSALFQLSDQLLMALGGTAAVAIGFAFKDLLASLMAGIILLFDRPFQVGDRVEFGGHYGEVTEIGLRAVRINTLDDNLVSVPNNLFLGAAVSCANAGALEQMCVLRFYIGCDEDLARARRIVYEATAASRYVYLNRAIGVAVREGPVSEGAMRFAITLTVKAYVLDGRYETAFGTDVTERVLRAFHEEGVRTAGQIAQAAPVST